VLKPSCPDVTLSLMKKKKPANQASRDFNNKPLQALKGLKPAAQSDESSKYLKREESKQVEDDSELFLQAVASVQKLRNESAPSSEPTREQPEEKNIMFTQQDQQLFLDAMRQVGTTLIDFQEGIDKKEDRPRRSPSSRMRQLKHGTIRIRQELDLHGLLREEAISQLEHFIASAFSRGMEAVLVITGKGINSPEGPVLRGATEAWLRGKGKRMVAEFSPAPRDKGGRGAFVVFLRKHD
jgi:DNA-nicking Smr family endonuclease